MWTTRKSAISETTQSSPPFLRSNFQIIVNIKPIQFQLIFITAYMQFSFKRQPGGSSHLSPPTTVGGYARQTLQTAFRVDAFMRKAYFVFNMRRRFKPSSVVVCTCFSHGLLLHCTPVPPSAAQYNRVGTFPDSSAKKKLDPVWSYTCSMN